MAASSSQWVASNSHGRLESKDLPSVCRLGKGLSGFVYETEWKGNKHAKKDFPLGSVKHGIFEKEASALLDLDHPNVVKCLGYTVGRSSCSLLQEYVDDNLQTTIQRRIEAQRKKNSTNTLQSRVLGVDEIKCLLSSEVRERGIAEVDGGNSKMPVSGGSKIYPFEMAEAVQIISQMASGMKYLHDSGVVHGDLKPRNVLMCLEPGEKNVKVADFGMVETKKRIKLVSKRTRHREILTWKAPELLEELLGPVTEDSDGPFTDSDTDSEDEGSESGDDFVKSRLTMADVYSFGLTCSYILGGKLLFPELRLTQLREVRKHGYKPELPAACAEYVKFIVHSCLQADPMSRPTFSAICTMKGLLSDLPHLMKGISTSKHTSKPLLMSYMDNFADEMLVKVFAKLPLFDLLRARTVCKGWDRIARSFFNTFASEDTTKSYCPLVFKRNSVQHLWCGYDSAANAWELLPPLTNLPQVDIRPLAGNGKRLLGFRITSVPSQLAVGNPFTNEWQTIPKSTETWGEVGNILVVSSSNDSSASFQIVAIREDATEIFHSQAEEWTKLRQSAPPGMQEITVLSIRDKVVSGTLCGGLVFCYGGDALVSFDVVAERWTRDHIRLPPHASPKCFQMLECVGNLFAAVEDVGQGAISVWGLGLRRREFFPLVEMPQHFYTLLYSRMSRVGKRRQQQLKAVGHKHLMYFWRNLAFNIVVFDMVRRTWAELPHFENCLRSADSKPDAEDIQICVDTSAFEP